MNTLYRNEILNKYCNNSKTRSLLAPFWCLVTQREGEICTVFAKYDTRWADLSLLS